MGGILDFLMGTGQGSGSANDQGPYQPGAVEGLKAYLAPGSAAARQAARGQQDTYQALMGQPGMTPEQARAFATDPSHSAYQAGLAQKALAATQAGLQEGGITPAKAGMLAVNPKILEEQAKPQVIAPGAHLDAGIDLGGAGGAPAAPPPLPGAPSLPAPGMPPAGGAPQPTSGMGGSPPPPSSMAQRTANGNGLLDPATLDTMANRALLGDDSVLKNAGMGALGNLNKAEIQKRMAALAAERGISPEELSGRTARFPAYAEATKNLTKIQTGMGTAGIDFQKIFPLFQKAVQKAAGSWPGGKIPSVRDLEMAFKTKTGNPDAIAAGNYLNTLANVYARAISTRPQGPTDSDKEHFREVLQKSWNPAQIAEAGVALNNEIKAAHDSVFTQGNRLKVQFNLADKAPAVMIAQAKDAIKRGADQAKVKEAIESKGLKADGL